MSFNAGGAVQGGMAGASAGSALGPWGTLGGAVIGGLAGGFMGGGNDGKKMQREAWDRQEMWMQNQLGWRVQDAVRAGIHPLAAIGSNLSPPTPATVIGDSGAGNLGVDLAEMGQGVSRAISAGMGSDAKFQTTMRALQIERGELENAQLRFNLQQMHSQAGNPPGLVVSPENQPIGYASGTRGHFSPENYPVSVQQVAPLEGQKGPVVVKPVEQPANIPGHPSIEAGNVPGTRYIRHTDGWQPMPGKESGLNDLELDNPYAFEFWLKNRVLPTVGTGEPPDDARLPKEAAGWWFNAASGLWEPYIEDPMFPATIHRLYKAMPWFRYRRERR